MIDNLSLAITHGLMFVAAVLLLTRPDLDDESAKPEDGKDASPRKRQWGRRGA